MAAPPLPATPPFTFDAALEAIHSDCQGRGQFRRRQQVQGQRVGRGGTTQWPSGCTVGATDASGDAGERMGKWRATAAEPNSNRTSKVLRGQAVSDSTSSRRRCAGACRIRKCCCLCVREHLARTSLASSGSERACKQECLLVCLLGLAGVCLAVYPTIHSKKSMHKMNTDGCSGP